MARSSLVSMVNFHWPLVRGETEIQSVLPRRSRSESPLYAHRVEMNVCKRILIVNFEAAPGPGPGATGCAAGAFANSPAQQ